MSIFGLGLNGFNSKPATQIKLELETSLKAGPLGQSAGTEPDGSIPVKSLAGQLVAILTDGFAGLWDLGLALFGQSDPATATGGALDAICAITGTVRKAATQSTATETCTGTPGTLLPVGRVVTVQVSGTRFLSQALGTISAVPAWLGVTGYSIGNRVTNGSSPARVYQCITTGVSAGAGGPTTTAADIIDGTVHWRYLGDGTGAVDVLFAAATTGVLAALSGLLTVIATPVSGWAGAINVLDATLGTDVEVDSVLRLRRQSELAAEGAGDPNAIRAAVLRVGVGTPNAVVSCRVFRNTTELTNSDGLPPKSVEVLVLGGLDADIAAVLFAEVAAGIETYGTTSITVTDSNGDPQVVKFTRPTAEPIYVRADVTYDPATFPATGGAALLAQAVAFFGSSYPVGKSVRASVIEAAVVDGPTALNAAPVPGVLDVTALYISLAPAPVSAVTIPIAARQIATFDTSRVTVNLTAGTP